MTDLEAMRALHDVLDPDTGIDLVNLGLIYDVTREGERVQVRMTLTSPSCPASEAIVDGVKRRLSRLAGVREVVVELTFDPPWAPQRITAAGRTLLGW